MRFNIKYRGDFVRGDFVLEPINRYATYETCGIHYTTQHNTTQHKTTQHSTTQHNTQRN